MNETKLNEDDALALASHCILNSINFTLHKAVSGEYVFTFSQDVTVPKLTGSVVLLQQGGTSLEVYVHAHDTIEDALADKTDCAEDGAYETSEPVEIPAYLSVLGERFYSVLDTISQDAVKL